MEARVVGGEGAHMFHEQFVRLAAEAVDPESA